MGEYDLVVSKCTLWHPQDEVAQGQASQSYPRCEAEDSELFLEHLFCASELAVIIFL